MRELVDQLRRRSFPDLVKEVGELCSSPLDLRESIESFNLARNCLEHAPGGLIERLCNTPEKDCLIVSGRRLRLFFQKGDQEVEAVIGVPGPENAALMLGAEAFEIRFARGQTLDMSLKHFIDVLSTCVCLRADLDAKLTEEEMGSTSI